MLSTGHIIKNWDSASEPVLIIKTYVLVIYG